MLFLFMLKSNQLHSIDIMISLNVDTGVNEVPFL